MTHSTKVPNSRFSHFRSLMEHLDSGQKFSLKYMLCMHSNRKNISVHFYFTAKRH